MEPAASPVIGEVTGRRAGSGVRQDQEAMGSRQVFRALNSGQVSRQHRQTQN